jgi:hypothetical protein
MWQGQRRQCIVHGLASRRPRWTERGSKMDCSPCGVMRKRNYGYKIEWADGAKVIYLFIGNCQNAKGGKSLGSLGCSQGGMLEGVKCGGGCMYCHASVACKAPTKEKDSSSFVATSSYVQKRCCPYLKMKFIPSSLESNKVSPSSMTK